MTLPNFSLDEYQQLLARSVVLEQDGHGVKVLQTPEGLIVKLFRKKRLISSAMFKSYARRFVENAKKLKALGVGTVQIQSLAYCKPIKRSLVFYQPIPGRTLRSALQELPNCNRLLELFAAFLADLHNQGIMFRSIHLNNVIVSEDMTELGLIDIADMKIRSKALSRSMRLRNFKHLVRYKADQAAINNFGVSRFMGIYFGHSSLPQSYKQDFVERMETLLLSEGRV